MKIGCFLFTIMMLFTITSFAQNYTVIDFAKALDKDPLTVYKAMLEQSTQISDFITTSLGFTKEQELAFLFFFLPSTSQQTAEEAFEKVFGKKPQQSLGKESLYSIFEKLLTSANVYNYKLYYLSLLLPGLPANTPIQKVRKHMFCDKLKYDC